jgi:predicted  nucleic acid-binding Zn-ribbon protein
VSDETHLRELMEADRWVDRVRAQREHLPELGELAAVESELRALAERLGALEAARRPARDAFNEAADRAESLRQRRADLERRLEGASAPARELATLQSELDRLAGMLNEAEDLEVALLLELEPLDEVAHEVRTQAQPLAQRRHDLQGVIVELQATLDDEITHLRARRDQLAERLGPALAQRYGAALARAGVSGAALVDGQRCDGCRVALSPLDLDRWRAAPSGSFPECPHCGRLLLTC